MLYTSIKRTASVCSLALALLAPAGATLIDDFTVDQGPLTNDTSQVLGSMLGGERDGFATAATLQVGSGVATLSDGLGSFIWDGVDGSSSTNFGLGGVDLTDGGASDRFLMDISGVSGGMSWFVQVFESSGNARTAVGSISGVGTVEILFSDLSVNSNVDLAAINQINLQFTGMDADDSVSFDNFRTGNGNVSSVPEPGTWLLMAGGLSLVALRRRFV